MKTLTVEGEESSVATIKGIRKYLPPKIREFHEKLSKSDKVVGGQSIQYVMYLRKCYPSILGSLKAHSDRKLAGSE